MTAEAFKSEVETAYRKAVANRNSITHYTDQACHIFDGVTVFGRDAGIDLIESVIGQIKEEAIRAAEGKRTSITLRPGKTGKAALAGMVETVRTMTGLKVTEGYGAITLAWE